jgi:CRP/FNR family transcriptional regulator, cyclic AMP receptor protein
MRKVLFILGHLSDDDVEWMARAGRRLAADDGEVLIRQGEPSSDLFFVLDGHAVVHVNGLGDVDRIGRGEVIGEMSFVDSAPPSATVRSDGGCSVLALDRRRVEARLREQPAFAGRFYKALAIFLADRLRAARGGGGAARGEAPAAGGLDADRVMEDELDDNVLDQVSLAGARFDRMLRTLAAAGEG